MRKVTKITLLLLALTIVSPILHNVVFALFKFEEPVFFILTFVFALGFLVSASYTLVTFIFARKNTVDS